MQDVMFELPLAGAAGYAAIETMLYADVAAAQSGVLGKVLPQGTAFEIVREEGDFWYVQLCKAAEDANATPTAAIGAVRHGDCFLNLPDVLPSVIYQNTNADASVMHSVGRVIPGITGERLYTAYRYNLRLGKQEYTMPVLYCTAKKIAAAHAAARAQGDAIVVYELFRPQHTQMQIVDCLSALANQDAEVLEAITAPPWEMDWFIATGVSTHQRGMAMDVGLAKVQQTKEVLSHGAVGLRYPVVSEYTLYEMPTPIHELSRASASMAYPITSLNDEAWRSVPNAPAMTEGACRLKQYCTDAGLTPLASEWWHFNDLEAIKREGSEHFCLPKTP